MATVDVPATGDRKGANGGNRRQAAQTGLSWVSGLLNTGGDGIETHVPAAEIPVEAAGESV